MKRFKTQMEEQLHQLLSYPDRFVCFPKASLRKIKEALQLAGIKYEHVGSCLKVIQ